MEQTVNAVVSDRELKQLNRLMAESLTGMGGSDKVSAAEDFPSLRDPNDEQIVWIETGNEKAGLNHIISEHGQQFSDIGIENDMISAYIMEAVSKGKIVGYQGRKNPRAVYEFEYGGEIRRVAVSIGKNGFVVGANPKSWKG